VQIPGLADVKEMFMQSKIIKIEDKSLLMLSDYS